MNYYKIVLIAILINLMKSVYCDNSDFNETSVVATERILSRRKRHLIFPEGSSIQTAIDYLIPTFGIPKIFVIGMSISLAWELPSVTYRTLHLGRPRPAVIEYLKQKKAEKEAALKETAMKLEAMEQEMAEEEGHDHDHDHDDHAGAQEKNYGGWGKGGASWANDRKDTSARKPQVSMKWPYSKNGYNKYSSPSSAQFFSEKYNKPYYTPPQDQEIRTKSISGYRKHRIYPIFTKRSIEDDVELHHHRKTRRSLYVKIARMFSSQGKNGHECVLKALCEAGKKRNEGPGYFLDEILKAIFTIPNYEDLREQSEYDDAHYTKEDCKKKFPLCTNSIFKDSLHKFVLKKS